MGAFNVLPADLACPRCHTVSHVEVQFKYGATRQYEYKVGDSLEWGGNDIGVAGHREVVVLGGVGDACQTCGYDGYWDAYVYLQDDEIVGVEPANGSHDFVAAQETFIVLDP